MGPFTVGILVPLGFFAMLFGIVYLSITARNRERMAMIEKGADPSLFEARKRSSGGGIMKFGMFLFGIGLGIVVASLIASGTGMHEGAAYPAMIFIFGGLALIAANVYQRKQDQEDELKNK